jgi:hypothetical protein
MGILIIAFAILAAVWVVVIVGSGFFGPKTN